tara:strand:- start:1012 stop:1272 length:261 start_codon:yes stop_codon:yes gene_type:complete
MGRLVLTHSTYVDGLLNWAKKFSENEEIKTITPGVIGKTRANCTNFTIRISRKLKSGYKLIARKGKTFQEVYVITEMNYESLERII